MSVQSGHEGRPQTARIGRRCCMGAGASIEHVAEVVASAANTGHAVPAVVRGWQRSPIDFLRTILPADRSFGQ
jgi:hypothetical protein